MPPEELMKLPPELLLRAVPGSDGCDEVAWFRTDAMAVVSWLAGSAVAVLGGDVLRRSADCTTPTLDNWYSERLANESWLSYATRTHRETEGYLRNYPDPEDGTIAYVLVLRAGA